MQGLPCVAAGLLAAVPCSSHERWSMGRHPGFMHGAQKAWSGHTVTPAAGRRKITRHDTCMLQQLSVAPAAHIRLPGGDAIHSCIDHAKAALRQVALGGRHDGMAHGSHVWMRTRRRARQACQGAGLMGRRCYVSCMHEPGTPHLNLVTPCKHVAWLYQAAAGLLALAHGGGRSSGSPSWGRVVGSCCRGASTRGAAGPLMD
jgi:hypothetical protein